MLSGIGPAAHLAEHGIDVVADRPGVGGNLQDHLAMSYYYKANQPTLNNVLSSWLGKLRVGLQLLEVGDEAHHHAANHVGAAFGLVSSLYNAVPEAMRGRQASHR